MTIITRAFRGDIISPDGKRATVSEPDAVKGLRWTYDLAQKDKVLALPGGFEGTAQSLFASGKLGLTQTSAVGMYNIMDAVKDPKVAKARTVLVPKRPDGIFPSQTRAGNWVVGSKSKNPEPSWEFVKHQSSREGCLLFTRLSKASVGCVRPDVLDDPFFAEPNFQPLKEMLLRALPNYAPVNYRGTEYQDAFNQTHSLIYLGKLPFDQGVKDLNDALQRVLDKPTT
jgi:ABC-type glycerol-3-phosphate transport system substrate-binding protein